MVANTPRTTRRAITSLARMPSFSARSFTEIPSVIVMLRVIGAGSLLMVMRGGGCSPSSGLPSRLAVHISVPAAATDLQDELPDASLPAAPFPLPDPRRVDAIPRAQRGWDASAAVLPDEAADAVVPAPVVAPNAEKLAAPVPVVPASTAVALPAAAEAPCTPGAGPSAA